MARCRAALSTIIDDTGALITTSMVINSSWKTGRPVVAEATSREASRPMLL